MVSLAVG